MDILAHTLWAAAGAAVIHRRRPLPRRAAAAALFLAAVPDVVHLLPIVAWWMFGDGTSAAVRGYAMAVPGQEPWPPSSVQLLSHHLHCVMHSAPIAAVVTAPLRAVREEIQLPLLGWWPHIVIDVFTHSADDDAVPALYPFTERGFDGIAWTTPWFRVANDAALAVVGGWLLAGRDRPRGR